MEQQPHLSKPFALFRLPGESALHLWEGAGDVKQMPLEGLIQSANPMWVSAPFDFYGHKSVWAFEAVSMRKISSESLAGWNLHAGLFREAEMGMLPDTPRHQFEKAVEEAVLQIREGKFLKTALSKIRNVELDAYYDWMDWFIKAKNRFSNALVFFVHLPGIATWAGATPELFLSCEGEAVKSVSLAGTLHPDSQHGWREKESREQSLVSDFITETFLDSGFHQIHKTVPEVLQIGALRHIHTEFSASLPQEGLSAVARLAEMLHPTPAVGGLPQKEGVAFILNTEKHERFFYSGFMGPWYGNGRFDWFVNLRSMQLFKNRAVLYAGAGITEDSNPEEEWTETENKLRMNADILTE